MNTLDCLIIGHNHVALGDRIAKTRAAGHLSGEYTTIKANTVPWGDERLTYLELLNRVAYEQTGVDPALHVCKLPHLGTRVLSGHLARHGLTTEVINYYQGSQDRIRELLHAPARTVAITTTQYTSLEPIVEIVELVRSHAPSTTIIVGGPYILNVCTGTDEVSQAYLLRQIGADYYVRDPQGERALAQLVRAIRDDARDAIPAICNLLYFDGDALAKTEVAAENISLDEVAVDWASCPAELLSSTMTLRTSRGCPYTCAFCTHRLLGGGHAVASLATVERELCQLRDRGVERLLFVDDTLNVPIGRFKEMCRMMIRHKFDFRWYAYIRCSEADEEAYDLMAASGCAGAYLGIESFDQEVLERMNKKADAERYVKGIHALRARGILSYVALIVGFPGETRDSVRRTIETLQACQPDFYRASLWWCSWNAPVQKKSGEFGLRSSGFRWKHDTMDWKEACDSMREVFRTVSGPILWPVHDADFWVVPYLEGAGMTIDQIKAFGRAAGALLAEGFDDEIADLELHRDRLHAAIRGARLVAPR